MGPLRRMLFGLAALALSAGVQATQPGDRAHTLRVCVASASQTETAATYRDAGLTQKDAEQKLRTASTSKDRMPRAEAEPRSIAEAVVRAYELSELRSDVVRSYMDSLCVLQARDAYDERRAGLLRKAAKGCQDRTDTRKALKECMSEVVKRLTK